MFDKQKSRCWVSHIILDIIIDLGCVFPFTDTAFEPRRGFVQNCRYQTLDGAAKGVGPVNVFPKKNLR